MGFISLKNTAPEACIAAIMVSDPGNAEYTNLIGKFWQMTAANSSLGDQMVGACCIGEYGKIRDLSSEAKVIPTVKGLF